MIRKSLQTVTATQQWRERMMQARHDLPAGVGQQDVINWIAGERPEIDRLTYATRWRNAWLGRVADPELTELVEAAAAHFKKRESETRHRLSRQKLKKKSTNQ